MKIYISQSILGKWRDKQLQLCSDDDFILSVCPFFVLIEKYSARMYFLLHMGYGDPKRTTCTR